MKVKVTSSLAGHGFSFSCGQIVDENDFASKVGSGWERNCVPLEEAIKPSVAEVSVDEPATEVAVNIPIIETATKRRRRK